MNGLVYSTLIFPGEIPLKDKLASPCNDYGVNFMLGPPLEKLVEFGEVAVHEHAQFSHVSLWHLFAVLRGPQWGQSDKSSALLQRKNLTHICRLSAYSERRHNIRSNINFPEIHFSQLVPQVCRDHARIIEKIVTFAFERNLAGIQNVAISVSLKASTLRPM